MPGSFILNGVEYFSSDKQIVELTQAQYNALPASKLSNNIAYFIKDMGGADSYPPLIYSDEEREIGVWRDGKPLYQKTIVVPISSITGSETTIVHNIANVDNIYFAEGCMMRAGNLSIPLVTYHTASSWACSIFNLTRTSFVLYLGSDEQSRVERIYITLKYTKTTDEPGSGVWTTQGTYAHHYSTTEHIIGTWIDGKPLYEITISDDTVRDGSASSEQTIYVYVPNIKEFISISGFASFGANTQWLPITFSDAVGNSLTNSRVKLISLNIGSTRFGVRFDIGNNYNGDNKINKVRFTVRYTKTTD